jgi:hypothetical protein
VRCHFGILPDGTRTNGAFARAPFDISCGMFFQGTNVAY